MVAKIPAIKKPFKPTGKICKASVKNAVDALASGITALAYKAPRLAQISKTIHKAMEIKTPRLAVLASLVAKQR